MEGFAYLFRIPNQATRNFVLNQGLWQIDGRTMFVAKWKPGPRPEKPELTIAPVWLELRDVPHQFFFKESLELIAGMVGKPIKCHPATLQMTDVKVAKVLTFIDPRKPLPEGVNVKFETGEIKRVRVSSPWMPPVCSFCNEVGHSLRNCSTAPKTCTKCNSTTHLEENCLRRITRPTKDQPKFNHKTTTVYKPKAISASSPIPPSDHIAPPSAVLETVSTPLAVDANPVAGDQEQFTRHNVPLVIESRPNNADTQEIDRPTTTPLVSPISTHSQQRPNTTLSDPGSVDGERGNTTVEISKSVNLLVDIGLQNLASTQPDDLPLNATAPSTLDQNENSSHMPNEMPFTTVQSKRSLRSTIARGASNK